VENGDVVFETGLDAALIVPSERAGPILNAVATQVDPEWALAMLLLRESNVGPSGPYAPFLRMALEELDDVRGKAEDSEDSSVIRPARDGSHRERRSRVTRYVRRRVPRRDGEKRPGNVQTRLRVNDAKVPGGVSGKNLRRL
jgi:hypothetical protein